MINRKCKYCDDKNIPCRGHYVTGLDKNGKQNLSVVFKTRDQAEAYLKDHFATHGNRDCFIIDRYDPEFQKGWSENDKLMREQKQKMSWQKEVKKVLNGKN